jgi:hypothetical protein
MVAPLSHDVRRYFESADYARAVEESAERVLFRSE